MHILHTILVSRWWPCPALSWTRLPPPCWPLPTPPTTLPVMKPWWQDNCLAMMTPLCRRPRFLAFVWQWIYCFSKGGCYNGAGKGEGRLFINHSGSLNLNHQSCSLNWRQPLHTISFIHPPYLPTHKWTIGCVQCRNEYHNSHFSKSIFEYRSI